MSRISSSRPLLINLKVYFIILRHGQYIFFFQFKFEKTILKTTDRLNRSPYPLPTFKKKKKFKPCMQNNFTNLKLTCSIKLYHSGIIVNKWQLVTVVSELQSFKVVSKLHTIPKKITFLLLKHFPKSRYCFFLFFLLCLIQRPHTPQGKHLYHK